MNVKDFREAHGLKAKDIISIMRPVYKGYDKTLHSKVENPDTYGVTLIEDAERMLNEHFILNAPKPRKAENRRLKARVSARLSKSLYTRLQLAQKRDGHATMQDELTHIIKSYCDMQERK